MTPGRSRRARLVAVLAAFVIGTIVGPIRSPSIVEAAEPAQRRCQEGFLQAARPKHDAECLSRSEAEVVAAAIRSGFQESVVWSGLTNPVAVRFASDGRVFVAEKSGTIKIFDSLTDPTPTSFTGLQSAVHNFWDRGLLGFALDPSLTGGPGGTGSFIYVMYAYDHILSTGEGPPKWGDACPGPPNGPGATTDGCVVSSRLSRFPVNGTTVTNNEQVLLTDWCQQYPSHSAGGLAFGPDGALYVSGGDGANFNVVDYGQRGGTTTPVFTGKNPCDDPPDDAMTPPAAEGGALRSQDIRTNPNGSGGGPSYSQAVLADSPLAYWRLGESGGTLADDAVGSRNGTYIGGVTLGQPGALSGDSNTAVGLNGTTGFVRVPQITLPAAISLEAWVKPTTYPGDTALAGQWNGTGGAMLYATSDFGGRIYLWINGNAMFAAAPTPGAWHHVVGTYDGTNGRIYIDGNLVAGPTAMAGPLTTAPVPFEIGTYNNGGGGKLGGVVDEVALYASALSASRVQAHWQAASQSGGGGGDPVGLDGTVLRVDPTTGAGVAGNPFATSNDANARRIIAYGLRNPFRLNFRPGTNELWVGDVGWTNWEELNRIVNVTDSVAENFGWPCYEGTGRHSGYDGTNLGICETLYGEGAASHNGPHYTYNHAAKVVTGETCPVGSSAITGVAFYPETGGDYPASYRGGVFFADHSRDCVWFMRKGSNGQPDPTQIETFIAPAPNPVDLVIGPNSDLFYVDFDGGTIRRITFTSGNQPPVALIDANPTSGPAPLTVQFNGGGSSDPEGGPLTYAWDLDGDGQFDDATGVTTSRTFTSPGNVTVGLRVTDNGSATGTDTQPISVGNSPPAPVITTPTTGTTWTVGQSVGFSGSATDPQDGDVPASGLSWSAAIVHCPSNCHTHPPFFTQVGGASGTLTTPDHDYPSSIEITLTATDSNGTSASVTRTISAQGVALTFQSSPSGLSLVVNGTAGVTPFTRTVIVGSANSVTATSPQTLNGQSRVFSHWSDGGAQTHTIVAPSVPTTYTATYQSSGFSVTPAADAQIRSNQASRNFGSASVLRVRVNQSRVYLKFTVAGLSSAPSNARLRLWVTDGSTNGGSVYAIANTTWTESGITWNNAPPITGNPIASVGAATAGTWVEINLGTAITGNGTYTFAISNGNTNLVDYASRETTNDPVLVITP